MGLWDSIIICLVFSFVVIGLDEWMHKRRRERRQKGK
jgi:hypothetical protein